MVERGTANWRYKGGKKVVVNLIQMLEHKNLRYHKRGFGL